MKRRWMKSVIDASKTEAAPLPFERGSRNLAARERLKDTLLRKRA